MLRMYANYLWPSLYFLWISLCELWELVILLTRGAQLKRLFFKHSFASHEDTCGIITTCLEIYSRCDSEHAKAQLYDLLSGCDAQNIVESTTEDGYNLLQLAVSRRDTAFVRYLLTVKKCNPNIAQCSLPLHIAIYQDYEELVQLLLSNRAQPYRQAGMCYPQSHVPRSDSHSKFFFVNRSMVCGGVSKDAYQLAMSQDNVNTLQILMTHRASPSLKPFFLHYACLTGAFGCVQALVDRWGCDVNAVDSHGCTPVMLAITGSRELVEFLVSRGADITTVSYQSQSIMHKLFADYAEDPQRKTKLLLALGGDAFVNQLDVFHNTPLHYLMRRYSRNISMSQEEALRECIGLLLHHNSDPLVPDSENCLPLLRLLQYKDRDGLPNPECLNEVLRFFGQYHPKALQTPLDAENRTAIFYLTEMCLMTGNTAYIHSVRLCSSFGANINHVTQTRLPSVKAEQVLLPVMHSLVSLCKDKARAELKLAADCTDLSLIPPEMLTVSKTLKELFRAGFDPNIVSHECKCQCRDISSLSCFVHLIDECYTSHQLRLTATYIRTALQWGANPDEEMYSAEPTICTSQSNIFLRRESSLPLNHFMQEGSKDLWTRYPAEMGELLQLFVSTMSHCSLRDTVLASHAVVCGSSYSHPIASFLRDVSSQPPSLKLSAKRLIYKAIGRRLAERVGQLPLPLRLKNELLNIA